MLIENLGSNKYFNNIQLENAFLEYLTKDIF